MKRAIKQLLLFIISGLVFLFFGGVGTYVFLGTRYVSEPWHVVALGEEFRAAVIEEISDFDDYLDLEDRLFKALRDKIYKPPAEQGSDFDRYRTGSRSDPSGFLINWNRSFELAVDHPRGGILMMHGLTDSPYSVRSLAQKMQKQGFWVVGLRLPGHGTIPSELLNIQWEDWAAAARIGARRVKEKTGKNLPLYLLGYSTGAALAVEYALSELEGEAIPKTDGLILLSPAISLPPTAGLAKFQMGLSRLPGLGKMAWESVSLEYDPYKYNSFPVNAGNQVNRLAINVQKRIIKMDRDNTLLSFPKVIAFQSIVDGTIQADGVVDKFLMYLPAKENRLVMFDINQRIMSEGFLINTGDHFKARLLGKDTFPFTVELITNRNDTQDNIQVVLKKSRQSAITWEQLPYFWPPGIYSLSHVALPFPPDDPIYGDSTPGKSEGSIRLGNINGRGEKNVFAIPQKNLMRLRYNPFYIHLENCILRFLEVDEDV